MITPDTQTYPVEMDLRAMLSGLPLAVGIEPDLKLYRLLADLDPANPWLERKQAAEGLGRLRERGALPGLLAALRADPFWMVRCAIIQALEWIGDPAAVPALEEAAAEDEFQVVRGYAAKALRRLAARPAG